MAPVEVFSLSVMLCVFRVQNLRRHHCGYGVDVLCLHIQPLHVVGVLLLGNDFARIELDKHGSIRLEFDDGYREAKVIQEKKL